MFKVGSMLVISLASNQRDHTPGPESVTTLKKKKKSNDHKKWNSEESQPAAAFIVIWLMIQARKYQRVLSPRGSSGAIVTA